MQLSPKFAKSFADRLAKLIAASEDDNQMIRLLRLTNFVGNASSDASTVPAQNEADLQEAVSNSSPSGSVRVGIWERRQENGKTCFVRCKDTMGEWNYWANVGRIDPKGAKKRVVLVGESVARGYLFDPQFTPAMVLEKVLQSNLGKTEVEVIDLARTGLSLHGAKNMAKLALLLEPDAVVIFAGNNWRGADPFKSPNLPSLDSLTRLNGIAGTKQFAENNLADSVTELVRDVASLYQSRGVALVWIVPEFNLIDWRDPITNAPHLPNGANREWIDHWQAAQSALQAEDSKTASALAKRMCELDQGVSVTGPYILAECNKRLGDVDSVRCYLEMARDSLLWDSSQNPAPRTHSITQQILRREAGEKHKNEIVDVPKLFKEYLGGELPGRRLFLDYCHLTSEGMQIVMSAAASGVLRAIAKKDVHWRELMRNAPAPTHEVEGEAAFLAAVHNAHWWQSCDLLQYYCSRAIQFSAAIAPVMLCFMEIQAGRAPMLMCRAAERITELGSPLVQHYLLRYSYQQLDNMLLDAIILALRKVGIEAQEDRQQLWRNERSLACQEIDLLDYYYNSAALQPQDSMWMVPAESLFLTRANHFYKARCPESRFIFLSKPHCPVELQLTCRIPHPEITEEPISLCINEEYVGEMSGGREWKTWDITLSGDIIKDGLNEIAIRWPIPDFPGQRGLDTVANDFSAGRIPEFFCVFGEIHTFTASDGRKAKTLPTALTEELGAVEVH